MFEIIISVQEEFISLVQVVLELCDDEGACEPAQVAAKLSACDLGFVARTRTLELGHKI